MKRLSRQIAYETAYGSECFVLDKDAVKDFIESKEPFSSLSTLAGIFFMAGTFVLLVAIMPLLVQLLILQYKFRSQF